MTVGASVGDPRPRASLAWVLDGVLILACCALALPYLAHSDNVPHPRGLAVAGAALLIAPLAVRRRWPVGVFAVIMIVAIGVGAWDTRLVGNLALPIALYTVAATGSRRRTYECAAALELLVVVAAIRIGGLQLLAPLVFLTGMVAAAAGLGLYTATRRDYIHELVERADRLERERAQADELAIAGERERIAREMHDIVAHHLTVIVALSDAAGRLARTDPDRAGETVATIGTVGRDALRDTRGLLGVLAHTAGVADRRHPVPGIADLDALVDHVRSAGLSIEFRVHGRPESLPPETQLAVYRLVQESVTNTMKHAGAGAVATLSLDYEPTTLRVRISDDGAGRSAATDWRPGRGTSGMRARIEALEGRLASGPQEPAGWRVDARLPLGRVPENDISGPALRDGAEAAR